MKFEKKVLFLGMSEMTFRDGHKMYTVEFFSAGDGAVKVNVMDSEVSLVQQLSGFSFGVPLTVVFRLREFEKAYKLGLVSVSRDGKSA